MEGNLFMEVNRETAMRLWNKNYGKRIQMKDFAGREMLKAAYDDRNSEFGWNLDHIYPVSKGGKTSDYNLICCNIRTNDEKANRFPVFKANGKKFQIARHENHYEIENCNSNDNSNYSDTINETNMFDSAEGVEALNECKTNIDETKYIDFITVYMQESSLFLVEFLRKYIFKGASISIKNDIGNCAVMKFVYFDKTHIDDFRNELDNCILLNTYMKDYILPKNYLKSYEIVLNGFVFNNSNEYYNYLRDLNGNNYVLSVSVANYMPNKYDNCVYLDEFVADNLKIDVSKLHLKQNGYNKVYKYDYVFTNLEKNLLKEVHRK